MKLTSLMFSYGSRLIRGFRMRPWVRLPQTDTSKVDENVVVAHLVYVHRNTALLHKLCVVEAYRREGIGEQLLLHAIKGRVVNN